MRISFIILLLSLLTPSVVLADVVKPALVEIEVNSEKALSIEIRASIEALLTGINSQYKNTKDAPTAKEYDQFREMSAGELEKAFVEFQQQLLDVITVKSEGAVLPLAIESVNIPPTGYTKVPRISIIRLSGALPESATSLTWYYPERFGDNAVRVKQVDLKKEKWHWSPWQWLKDDKESTAFSLTEIVTQQSLVAVVTTYVVLGFEHIVPKGLDHILFILGLFLLSTHWRPLFWQVTMFTVAHTITLGLAMNNVVELPANIVEPLIALSIAYIGIENVLAKGLNKSRLFLVFGFGLIHGLGFAGVLSDFGLPDGAFIAALVSFNIGVELGQIAIIVLSYFLVAYWFKNKERYRAFVVVPISLLISIVGAYWFFDRLIIF